MANNYMFLCYKPTGRIIQLAKRMGFGWHTIIDNTKLETFLNDCEKDTLEFHKNQDNFCLLMEDDNDLSDNNKQKWDYDNNKSDPGKFQFVKFID